MKAAAAKQKDGGKGKRKRNEKKGTEKKEGEGNGEGQEITKKRKLGSDRKQEKPLSEEKQEEKKLESQIGEQLKWLCEQDDLMKGTLKEVIDAQTKGHRVSSEGDLPEVEAGRSFPEKNGSTSDVELILGREAGCCAS